MTASGLEAIAALRTGGEPRAAAPALGLASGEA
jgi:hypothetical protein